jgi:group I intron endonuclease
MSKTYIVYCYTNLINLKMYVGQTCQTLEERWYQQCCESQSNMVIGRAIKKYGKEAFTKEVLAYGLNKETANVLEREYIHLFKHLGYILYNVADGGTIGDGINESIRRKMSEGQKRQWNRPGQRERMSARRKVLAATTNVMQKCSAANKSATARAKRIETMNSPRMQEYYKTRGNTPVYCVETNTTYISLSQAAQALGVRAGNICNVLQGKRNHTGGYHFRVSK